MTVRSQLSACFLMVPFVLLVGCMGSDGQTGTEGMTGTDGMNGMDGTDGMNGMDGTDGMDGADGTDGMNGMDGTDGMDGMDGMDGTDGMDGMDGTDGGSCTVEEVDCVATMNCEDGSTVSWDLEGCNCDECGVCDGEPANDNSTCTQDCAGTWDGTATSDECGVCDDDPSNDCVLSDEPIEPPAGTDTTPEENNFDWSVVSTPRTGDAIPQMPMVYPGSYPRYGVASILPYSDSELCVCFDAACATCSQDNCGATNCTYDLNSNHTLTKYHVELRSLANQQHAVTFEVNLSANPPINYTDLNGVLSRLERTPVAYWTGYKIITEFGRGIQFLHGSYFNGAAAYGSMNYIDTQTADMTVLLHELGHTFEQFTRRGGDPYRVGQSNILDPVWRHAIRADDNRTSWYGNNNEWEDLAEFARIYAMGSIEGSLDALQALSPERFRIWERILVNGASIMQ